MKRIITGDEKYIVYNIKRKLSCCQFGAITNELCILRSFQATKRSTFTSNIWRKLEEEIKKKRTELANRKKIVLHHDNARPYTPITTRTKLLELVWEAMSHPPYSQDLALSDYYLFQSLQNFLNCKHFDNKDNLKSHVVEYFNDKLLEGHRIGWKIFDRLEIIFCI